VSGSRERNRVQWARIAGILAVHPEGLSTPQVARLCGFAGRPRERAVARSYAFLQRMEWHGQVTRCEHHDGLAIFWRLTGAVAAQPDRWDFTFGDAGSVSVIVNVRWLDLHPEKFTKLTKIIRELEVLAPVSRAGQTEQEDDHGDG